MKRNFHKTSNPNIVQFAVVFQSAVQSLNGPPASIESFPLRCFLCPGIGFLVGRVGVNDWLGPVLAANQTSQWVTGVTSIAHNVLWIEAGIGKSGLSEQWPGLGNISCVARGDFNRQWQFISGVTEDVDFVAPDNFVLTLGIGLDNPSRFRVRDFTGACRAASQPLHSSFLALLAGIRPCFDVSAINGNRFSEIRQGLIQLASQIANDIFDFKGNPLVGQLSPKAGESGLTGDFIGRVDTTGLGDEGVIVEDANQGRDGFKAHVVVGDVAVPEDFRVVAFWPTPGGAFELFNKSGIVKLVKDSLKLANNWRHLSILSECPSITRDHREADTFLWLRGRRVLPTPCGSARLFAVILPVCDEILNGKLSKKTKERCQFATSIERTRNIGNDWKCIVVSDNIGISLIVVIVILLVPLERLELSTYPATNRLLCPFELQGHDGAQGWPRTFPERFPLGNKKGRTTLEALQPAIGCNSLSALRPTLLIGFVAAGAATSQNGLWLIQLRRCLI